jgi:hypothetical protein
VVARGLAVYQALAAARRASAYHADSVQLNLKTCTFCRAMVARRNRRISSSVFPQNMEPVMTSTHPVLCFMRGLG